MTFKKTIIFFGAVLISLMMLSNVSAVQHLNSQTIVKTIDQKNEIENFMDDCYSESELGQLLKTSSNVELPDNQLISNLKFKLDQFSTRYGVGNNIDNFNWKNQEQKQLFINFKNDIENDFQGLIEEISVIESNYDTNIKVEDKFNENIERYQNWDKGFFDTVSSTVWNFFEGYIKSDEFNNLEQSFVDTGIYDELEGYIGIALREEEGDIGFEYSGIIDNVMIFICYVVFMANYVLFGPTGSQATDELVALLLGIILFIPASISVIFHYLSQNVVNAGIAFVATVEVFLAFYGGTLLQSLQFGIAGFLIWAVFAVASFTVGGPVLAVAFILTWISKFIEISDEWEPGDIINVIPQYVHDIIMAAWEMVPNYCGSYSQNKLTNYVDKWCDIWPLPEPDTKPKSRTNNFFKSISFERFIERVKILLKNYDFYYLDGVF